METHLELYTQLGQINIINSGQKTILETSAERLKKEYKI